MGKHCLIALLLLAGGHQLVWAHNAFVVTDPDQLQLIDLKESYVAVNKRLGERPDILSPA